MDAARILQDARLAAGLSQRQLAERVDVPQPAIARIESGAVTPRIDTIDRLLAGCGRELRPAPRPGAGIDRASIRALLALTPAQRLRLAAREARNLERMLGGVSR